MKMTSGTKYKQGDVVIAPCQFSDLTAAKPRPNLIISNSRLNNLSHDNARVVDYWLVPISSSQIDQPGVIHFSPQDQQMFMQDRPSVIKPWKIYSIAEPLIQQRKGRISSSTLEAVIEAILQFIEYDTGRLQR